jgi:hypothetical protein
MVPNDCNQDINVISCYFFGAEAKLDIYSDHKRRIKERYFPKENTLFFLFQNYRGNSIISNYFGMNNESQR